MSNEDRHSQLLVDLQTHAERASEVDESRTGEAETKNFLIEPFLEILGYDCRNQRDVWLEYTADVAGLKGEKVDYVLIRDDNPVILVEAKARGTAFSERNIKQVARYFPHVISAQIAIFTDGINWLWFKGQGDSEGSHLLDTRPFLTYNVQNPSDEAAEWLVWVSKPDFDVGRLLHVARRLEFIDRVYNWIHETLVKPNHQGASVLNSLGEIGATEKEIPLLVDAVDVAMRRIMAEHATVPEQPAPPDEPSGTSHHPHPAVLEHYTHPGEHLDVGDGRVLDAKRKARAWRVGRGEWQEERNSTSTTLAVLGKLLSADARRHDEGALALTWDSILFFDAPPDDWHIRQIPGMTNLYWNINVSNTAKVELLKEVASNLEFGPASDHDLARNPRIEWWLPPLNITRT